MALIIPMSGTGKRFISAGYKIPKPLIRVDGKPIIEHVIDMYPGEKDVIFICNSNHLKETNMAKILKSLVPLAKVISISPHNLGPIYAIQQAYEHISDNAEVMISYCDFRCSWDYNEFKKKTKEVQCDGAIPSYIGFHPHMLGQDFYGHIKVDKDNFMLQIKEKESFTQNKMEEHTAAGSYWFRRGDLMKKYFNEAVRLNMKTGTEYFCSLPFNLLVEEGFKVIVYEIDKFCQWGTPHDLEEYEAWSRVFEMLSNKKRVTDIPKEREDCIKLRQTSLKDYQKTFAYWREFFASMPWHPYKIEKR